MNTNDYPLDELRRIADEARAKMKPKPVPVPFYERRGAK